MDFKNIRKKLKITQIEAAKKVNVSLTTWRMWECGVTEPNKENKNKLKEIFDINIK